MVSGDFEEQESVIGRSMEDIKEHGSKGTAFLGKVVMSSGEQPVLGRKVLMDVARPHLTLICGKRGGGKSYTMGVLVEELARLPATVRERIAVIVIDTVGIFWTLKVPSKRTPDLNEWDLSPAPTRCRVLVPKGRISFYQQKSIPTDGAFTLKTSELAVEEWLALFRMTWREPEGVLLTRIVEKLNEKKGTFYDLEDMAKACDLEKDTEKTVREALKNRLRAAKTWGLFEREGTKIKDLAIPGAITVIDVSAYRQAIGMEGTRDIIVGLLGKKLFEERVMARKEEEARVMRGQKRESDLPLVWMLIDEAHMFMPKDERSIALNVLLEWIRVGRQPGLSLVLATQRPNKLHPDAISQCDMFISHRMTSQPDIAAVAQLRPSYLHQDFDRYYEEMPRGHGYALVLDDHTEKMWLLKVRPRMSWDGGETATAFTK